MSSKHIVTCIKNTCVDHYYKKIGYIPNHAHTSSSHMDN